MSSDRYSCPILTVAGMYQHVGVKTPNTKFQENRRLGFALFRVDMRALGS
jgi:hypothetical protein